MNDKLRNAIWDWYYNQFKNGRMIHNTYGLLPKFCAHLLQQNADLKTKLTQAYQLINRLHRPPITTIPNGYTNRWIAEINQLSKVNKRGLLE